jgi:hypothetical protein
MQISKSEQVMQKPTTNIEFRLLGYETISEMLAVDGKQVSVRSLKRYLRQHRDIMTPVKIGGNVGYPEAQVKKMIARLLGERGRREIYL